MGSLQIDVPHRNQVLAHHVHGGLRLLRDYVAKQGGADDRGERLPCLGSIPPSRALRRSALAISDASDAVSGVAVFPDQDLRRRLGMSFGLAPQPRRPGQEGCAFRRQVVLDGVFENVPHLALQGTI